MANVNIKTIAVQILVVLMLAVPAFGLSLDEAKSNGFLGERPDGYLGAVSSPSPEVKAVMDDINAKRRQKYQEISKRNGTELSVVEKLAGKTAIEKTPPGEFLQLPSGEWIKK